jgi:hypothetical protein
MPRITRRHRRYNLCKKLFFDSIRQRIIHELLHDDSSVSSAEAEASNIFALSFLQVMTNRYIDRAPRYVVSSYIVLESVLDMNDVNFLLHFRVQKDSFRMLVDEVKDYWEFRPRIGRHGRLYRRKAPVQNQLLVFLYVLGASGSDANYKKVASRFKISHGLVQIFVERCTRALISTFQSDVISWPDAAERKMIAKRFQDKYGFANCIGIIDGTVFPLAFKPSEYGEEYWYRKGGYCLHCLLICDDEMRILDYLVGWPGSVHDNRVWSMTDQCQRYFDFFSRLQYLLADSAFTTSSHCISAFKRLRGVHNLPADEELFNTLLAKARIKVEHCIGLLKNRFQCLRDIRTIINDDISLKRIIDRVTVCMILHNLLIGSSYPEEWENGYEEDLVEEDIEYEYDEQFIPVDITADGRCRRTEMMNYIIQWNGGLD